MFLFEIFNVMYSNNKYIKIRPEQKSMKLSSHGTMYSIAPVFKNGRKNTPPQ